jgi:hypothetical protein
VRVRVSLRRIGNDAVVRELIGGESHSFEVDAEAGQYLQALLTERGVDLVMSVMGPDGRPEGGGRSFEAEILRRHRWKDAMSATKLSLVIPSGR